MGPCHRQLALLISCCALASACDARRDAADAQQAFGAWHAAMRKGDRDAVSRHCTEASRQYVAGISLTRAQDTDLQILDCRVADHEATLRVREVGAAEAALCGTFVVVREDGEWRVDLIATAGHNSREIALPGPPLKWRFIPVPAVGSR